MCDTCDVMIEQKRTERESRDYAAQVETNLRRSKLPLAYRDGERTILEVRNPKAVAIARKVIAGAIPGMFLYGPAGPDKTTLAASTLAIWIAAGGTGMFVSMADLITDVHAAYSSNATITRNDIVQPLIDTQFLVIDDFDKMRGSEHDAGIVYQILDGRYRLMTQKSRRGLVITANVDLDAACRKFTSEDIAEPIKRRISEMTTALEMK